MSQRISSAQHEADAPRHSAAAPPVGGRFLWPGVVSLLVLFAVAAVGSWRDMRDQRRDEAQLEADVERTEARIEELEGRIEAMQTDPLVLERLAREELGYVRPGDLVFVFSEEGAAPRVELVEPRPESQPEAEPAG